MNNSEKIDDGDEGIGCREEGHVQHSSWGEINETVLFRNCIYLSVGKCMCVSAQLRVLACIFMSLTFVNESFFLCIILDHIPYLL